MKFAILLGSENAWKRAMAALDEKELLEGDSWQVGMTYEGQLPTRALVPAFEDQKLLADIASCLVAASIPFRHKEVLV